MNRTTWMMAASLALGAAVMYTASNFRIRVESSGPSEVAASPNTVAIPNASAPNSLPDGIRNPPLPPLGSEVRQAGFGQVAIPSATPPTATATPTTSSVALSFSKVEDDVFVWNIAPGSPMSGRVTVTGSAIKIDLNRVMTAEENGSINLVVNGTPLTDTEKTAAALKGTYSGSTAPPAPAAGAAPSNDAIGFTLLKTMLPGQQQTIQLSTTVGGKTILSDPLVLFPPLTGATDPPSLASYANSPFIDPAAIPAAPGKLIVFAPTPNGTYLRLAGNVGTANGLPTIRFFLQLASDPVKEFTPASGAVNPTSGAWDYVLNLGPIPANLAGAILTVRADYPGTRGSAYMKPSSVGLQINAAPASLDAPTITLPASSGSTVIAKADDLTTKDLTVYRANTTTLSTITVSVPTGAQALVLTIDSGKPIVLPVTDAAKPVVFNNVDVGVGKEHLIKANGVVGTLEGKPAQLQLNVRTTGPTIDGPSAPGFGTGNGNEVIVLRFSARSQLSKDSAQTISYYTLKGQGVPDAKITTAIYDSNSDTVTLTATGVTPGTFLLGVSKGIVDLYGNPVQVTPGSPDGLVFQVALTTQALDQLTSPTRGVTLTPGPYVQFPEYTPFRKVQDGFNPGDHVDTKVVRLYYYRDAHRVAMIVNRSVKSYSLATVDVRQRAADRARDDADQSRIDRKRLEGLALQASAKARQAEADLQAAQNRAAAARVESAQVSINQGQLQNQLTAATAALNAATMGGAPMPGSPSVTDLQARVNELTRQLQVLQQVGASASATTTNSAADINAKQQTANQARDDEVAATAAWQAKELEEQRARTNQFRREVAAATADPNTYGPGVPNSDDPVQQVSISVIGEGLIHLRGPSKGINVIRIMINQIDAPVGQVRIGVHTVQVNGERGNRMEKVVENIQRYIDHSRFLTAASSQMLRNAVTLVASRKAHDVALQLGPNFTQEARDQKYLHAFFGKDFIDELTLLDSEFLKTGNKILSIHSMDSTSLSSCLFLMALAKNDVRREILDEFQNMVQSQLPQAEWNYYLAGLTPVKCEACCDKKHYMLACNAKFASFLGFFNAEVAGNDTLTPLQREFIRLAQIFKAQMVTEITLKQRVLERSLVEDRVGDYINELKKAKVLEDAAKLELSKSQDQVATFKQKLAQEFLIVSVEIDAARKQAAGLIADCDTFAAMIEAAIPASYQDIPPPITITIAGKVRTIKLVLADDVPAIIPGDQLPEYEQALKNMEYYLKQFVFVRDDQKKAFQEVIAFRANYKPDASITVVEIKKLEANLRFLKTVIDLTATSYSDIVQNIVLQLGAPESDSKVIYGMYMTLKKRILAEVQGDLLKTATDLLARVDAGFTNFFGATSQYQIALQKAKAARRPLDEKKLLDLLVDDTEDKYIEQLEGTRAHTANVDNYIKCITTALDDDFNTQFYFPAFRKVREASRLWDVTLGVIETTTVLTNNRSFAKVSPSATFEFDLPKRDIMITEGFKSAKALFDDYGALMNDPTFLALGKLYSGVPSTSQFNGGAGISSVRNVLPGLPSSPDEMLMAQAGGGSKQFGSALEGLIPDPAIYKIETGTGFEIRPVLAPDGQAVVFDFDYLYTTDVREPVRADEKHLGRVKRHFVHTDVQLSNFELREVSKYMVALKVARTAKGVPLLQDIPGLGLLFRPLPSAESSLQENIIYSQATIFPTMFDLMGLRYAQAVADLDPLSTRTAEFAARYRDLDLKQRSADIGATRVDEAVRTPFGERRPDLYRPQVTIPYVHPNGYMGPGLRQRDSSLVEGNYSPQQAFPQYRYAPSQTWPSATRMLPESTYMPPPTGQVLPYSGEYQFPQPPGSYHVPGTGSVEGRLPGTTYPESTIPVPSYPTPTFPAPLPTPLPTPRIQTSPMGTTTVTPTYVPRYPSPPAAPTIPPPAGVPGAPVLPGVR